MLIANARTRLTLGALAFAGAVLAVEAARTTEGARIEGASERDAADVDGIEAPAVAAAAELAATPMRVRGPRPTPEASLESASPAEAAPTPPVAPPCRTDLSFVDAVTGREIDGCVTAEASTDERSCIRVPAPIWEAVEGDASGDDPRWRAKSATRLYRVPAPYFLWREAEAAAISVRATSFRVVQPLHRELDVRLRILLPDGSRAPWGLLTAVDVDGASEAASFEGVGRGQIRVHRVPWLPERTFTLRFRATVEGAPIEDSDEECCFVAEPELTGSGDGSTEWTSESVATKEFALTVPMPTSSTDPIELDVVLDWSVVASERFICHGFSCGSRSRCGCGRIVQDVKRGDARVRLVDAAGSPMAGVRVRIATMPAFTDADGVARVTGAREGAGVVVIEGAGYRFGRVPITIVAGQEVALDLVEAPASTLEIHVVDLDGRPVPSASVDVRSTAFGWFDVNADGVQRLDPFTDGYGVRLCLAVPCGTVRATARFAGRSGEAETLVRAGVPSVVTVVVN